MNLFLIVVAIGSLALALWASVFAWRTSRDERQRAAARVAALSVAAGVPPPDPAAGATRTPAAPADHPTGALTSGRRSHTAAAALVAGELETYASEAEKSTERSGVVLPSVFLGAGDRPRGSASRQLWLAAAAAIVAVVLGGFIVSRLDRGAAESAAAAPTPLELLSLGHQREGNNLAVTGLVRNPQAGPAVARVSAVVFLFDQQGTFVTSAKAPLDYVTLSGGDESPFVVKVQAPQSVARYRVSFRTEEATLPHIDRRGEPAVTAPLALTRQ
jgi:hypothetical protein